jgi:4-cresol dehydrogenase (hydroxylating)
MDGFAAALEAWRRIVGPVHVVTSGEALRAAEAATYATTASVRAILRPGDRLEVQACVRVAAEHRIPLYPISGGKNWGYGSRVPACDGSVIVDLGRMNRIVEFDEELAYVVVEPGVTQRQLHDYLRARGSRLWMDTTMSSPAASLIGNIVERGHGMTPYADHVAFACGFEVVLPNGDCLHSGYGRFPSNPLANLDRWGLGPALDGLFTQSNLGIVTKLTIWLMPAPEYAQLAVFDLPDDGALAAAVDAARRLRLDGTLKSGPQFANEYRGLQRRGAYPWADTGGRTPLAPQLARRLAKKAGIAPWTGVAGLYGSRREVAAQRARLRAALRPCAQRLLFLDEAALARRPATGRYGGYRRLYSLVTGGLEGGGLARAYWRKRTRPSGDLDLDRDRCGFIWCTALTPFRGREALGVNRTVRDVLLRHGFEPDIAMVSIRERVLHHHISIIYDREEAGEDERAMLCYEELSKRLTHAGFLPHRLPRHRSDVLGTAEPEYRRLLRAIKASVDPNGILAPGRYDG